MKTLLTLQTNINKVCTICHCSGRFWAVLELVLLDAPYGAEGFMHIAFTDNMQHDFGGGFVGGIRVRLRSQEPIIRDLSSNA